MAKIKSSKELYRHWQERVQWVLSSNFSISDTPETQTNRIKRAKKDYEFFVKTYFSHLANKPCGKFQIDAANYLKANQQTRALFEWARGHAKSSHLTLLIPLWLKIQEPRQINVMVVASKNEDAAIRLLSDLQAELQYNELLTKDFGQQVKHGSWADGEFRTADGCYFVAVGRSQTPRGLKDRGKRPDYIVMDDIDDDEITRNPRRVSEALDWCLTALAGTMAMGRGRFVMVGNRIGKDSILSRFAERPNIYHTVINALDKKGLPSWSENYTLAEIKSIRVFVGERRFEKEYMNNPVSEGSVFLKKYIRYDDVLDLKHYRTLICYTDPSFKDSSTADFKATMLVGKTMDGYYHVLKAYADRCSVTDMINWHYEIHSYINGRVPVLYYMESNFLQDLLLDEFRKLGVQTGNHIPIRGDNRKKPDKYARVEALQPLFEKRLIVLNKKEEKSPGMKVLEDQLLMFERGSKTNDDAPDALEGAIWMLNQRSRTATTNYIIGKRQNMRY